MTTHLHCLYEQGPKELHGLVTGVGLCGKSRIPRKELTAFVDDADCPECLERAAKRGRLKKRGPRPTLTTKARYKDYDKA